MMRSARAAVAAVVLFAGCAPTAEPRGLLGRLWRLEVGPQYRRPPVETPEDFRGRIGPAEAASFADLPWWQVFGDSTLQDLVRRALADNYDLQTAVARIEEARAQVGVAASDLYPHVGYQGSAERQKIFFTPTFPSTTFNTFQGVLNVAWEIDVWGRIRRATEAARAQFLATEEARRGVVVTLVSDVGTNYFTLLELDRELAIALDSAETYRRTLDVFTRRYVGGTDTKISTSRAEANLQSSIATVAILERQITQQEDALSVLLGANPGPVDRGMPLVHQATPVTPPGLTTDLLRRRPDIRQAEQNMINANAEVGVAVANFFPTIGLSAMYGNAGSKIVEAFREVADALAAEVGLAKQRRAQEAQVVALQEAVRLSLARYETGLSNYIEVLDALQLLYPAENALAQTQRDQLVAIVNLYKALGGGWAPPTEKVATRWG